LRALVLEHRAELAAAIRSDWNNYEIEALKARLARLLRVSFGQPWERLSARVEQLELLLNEIDEHLAEIAPDEPIGDARWPVRGSLGPSSR
jgi:hypothetical protein